MGFGTSTLILRLALLAAGFSWISWTQGAYAQPAQLDGDALRGLVSQVIEPEVKRESIPGLIVGVSLHGTRWYFHYSGTGASLPTRDTIVEIGSITKVFTTALLAEEIRRGRIDADASIQRYLPGVPLQSCTQKITPLELVDFRSGLPELPSDAPKNLEHRGIHDYRAEDFLTWLGGWPPQGEPCPIPARYHYSNASVGLLGPILASVTGASWQQLLAERITGPLGMADTAIEIEGPARSRLAQGHGPAGHDVIAWPVFAWYAAGALRSTARDMLQFGEAALGHETVDGARVPTELRDAFALAMQPIYRPENKAFQQAMGWEVRSDDAAGQMVSKAGGTDGFNSVVVIDRAKDTAVFIAADKAVKGIPELGFEIVKAIP